MKQRFVNTEDKRFVKVVLLSVELVSCIFRNAFILDCHCPNAYIYKHHFCTSIQHLFVSMQRTVRGLSQSITCCTKYVLVVDLNMEINTVLKLWDLAR